MQLRRIAAIDDQAGSVEMFSEAISQYMEAQPIVFDRLPATPDSVAAWVVDEAIDAVLIDQNLRIGNYGTYPGIEIAARLFEQHTPTVLTSANRMSDINGAIWYRRYLPAYLPKGHMPGLEEAMHRAVAEVNGYIPKERQPFRTVVRVDEIDDRQASLIIPAFDPHEWIQVSRDDLALRLGEAPIAGRRFMAEINIGAPSQNELFISRVQP